MFPPGLTRKTFAIAIVGDTLTEGAETFSVTLSNPINVQIVDNSGIATIRDDESPRIAPTTTLKKRITLPRNP
jgi:hypothetical protein